MMASTMPGIIGRSRSLTSRGKASHGGSYAGAAGLFEAGGFMRDFHKLFRGNSLER